MNRDSRLPNILLLVYSAVSIILLSLPLTGKVRAVKGCAYYLLNPMLFYGGQAIDRLADMPQDAARLVSVDLENRKLREEIRETELLRTKAESLQAENDRLRESLGMKPATAHVLRWTHVTERDPLNWHRSIIVDAGKADGIEINAPVLGREGSTLGVVGRVVEVGDHTAKVLLVTDELSAIAAYLPNKSWEGLVQGQGSFRMRMNYLSLEAQFSVGESVHTSPTSAIFPPDLLVGTISRVFDREPFLAFQSVEVTPSVHAAMLKEVLILSPKKARLP